MEAESKFVHDLKQLEPRHLDTLISRCLSGRTPNKQYTQQPWVCELLSQKMDRAKMLIKITSDQNMRLLYIINHTYKQIQWVFSGGFSIGTLHSDLCSGLPC